MKVIPTVLAGVLVVEPDVFLDPRGAFSETFRADRYAAMGIDGPFVQDNVSFSNSGVLRGLHFQHPEGQAKLLCVLRGEVFDVAVDVRVGSKTYGCAAWTTLSETNHRQLFVPAGFAHGFLVTSGPAIVAYKCTSYYSPSSEQTIRWDDPALRIPWPVADPFLSPRDAAAPLLEAVSRDRLPRFA